MSVWHNATCQDVNDPALSPSTSVDLISFINNFASMWRKQQSHHDEAEP